jgi:hypothetical protein
MCDRSTNRIWSKLIRSQEVHDVGPSSPRELKIIDFS